MKNKLNKKLHEFKTNLESYFVTNKEDEWEESYGINYTLIDSRTGINRWGALSLIDIADEVMLFAYPNKENMEGLKLIIDLIEDCKKLTIALSRIDQSSRGARAARRLFRNLGIDQEYIPIYYESAIALAEKYPMENYLKPYEPISEFILEEEDNIKISEYIKYNKKSILEILELIRDIDFESIITSRETKIVEKSNWIIVKSEADNINLVSIFEDEIEEIQYIDISDGYEEVESDLYIPLVSNLDQADINEEVKQYLQDQEEINNISMTNILIAYILKIINKNKDLKHIKIEGVKELIDKNFQIYVDYVDEEFKLDDMHKITLHYLEEGNIEISRELNIVIDFQTLLMLFKDKLRNELLIQSILETILRIITIINTNSNINLKLILDDEYYETYTEMVDTYSANTINLVWDKLNKVNVVSDIKEIFENTIRYIKDELLEDIYDNLISEDEDIGINGIVYSRSLNSTNMSIRDVKKILGIYKSRYKKEFCNIIYGKRINPDIYSKLLHEWVYEELKKNKKLNKQEVFKLIKHASKIEIESNNENKKSIIDFSSFKKS